LVLSKPEIHIPIFSNFSLAVQQPLFGEIDSPVNLWTPGVRFWPCSCSWLQEESRHDGTQGTSEKYQQRVAFLIRGPQKMSPFLGVCLITFCW
jgi:hypothetical protein